MRCLTCQFKQPQMVLTLFILVSAVDPPDLFWLKMAAVDGGEEMHL